MSGPSKIDWGRLAAYIDGEGTIYINRQQPTHRKNCSTRHFLCVMVTGTSGALMRWLTETFSGTVYSVKPNIGKKPVFRWQLNEKQAESVLINCLPYLIIKRDQAEVGLAFRKSKVGENYRGPGIKLSKETVAERDGFSQKIRDLNSRPDPLDIVQ